MLAILSYFYTSIIRFPIPPALLPPHTEHPSYVAFHIALFALSLRFYLPQLTTAASTALTVYDLGVNDSGAAWMIDEFVWELFDNKRGRKWEELRGSVLKKQGWWLVRMKREWLDECEDRWKGFLGEVAEGFRRGLEDSRERKSSLIKRGH